MSGACCNAVAGYTNRQSSTPVPPCCPLQRPRRRLVLGPLRQRAAHVGANWQVCLALDPEVPSDAMCPGVLPPSRVDVAGRVAERVALLDLVLATLAMCPSKPARAEHQPVGVGMVGEALPSAPAIVCLATRHACSFSHPPGWMSGACCSAVAWQSVVG